MARISIDGQQQPALPTTHFIDNRIYLDDEIFAAEQASIFRRCWRSCCMTPNCRTTAISAW